MILSIPVRKVDMRGVDGSRHEAYELINGFVRVTSENPADHDASAPVGGHILISNPFIEWAHDQVNRANLSAGEKIYIRLHTQPPSNAPDSDGHSQLNDNDIAI